MTLHLIFDTETTALIGNTLQPMHKQPRIIEFFGLMLMEQGGEFTEESSLHRLFNPGITITEEITRITGLKQEDIKGAPAFALDNSQIAEYIETAHVVVAHNLSYDMQVLNFEFSRSEAALKWPRRKICTVEATEHFRGFRLSLSALHEELFNETFKGAHRAENDVRALARCYIELTKRREL